MATVTGQSGTLLGPLTTVWVPPATCTAMIPLCDNCIVGYMAQSCDADIMGAGPVRDNTACWPPVLAKHASPTHPFNGWGFYSPGIQCPTGYAEACTTEYQKRGDWPAQFSLVEGETAIGCCPSGFECANNYGNTCIQKATQTTNPITVKTASCSGVTAVAIDDAVYPTSVTRIVDGDTITELRTMTIYAPMIQMNFRASDLVKSSTPPTASSESTAATSSGTSESQSTTMSGVVQSQEPVGEAPPATSMDSGLKIGVTVGCIVGALAVGAMIAWLVLRRRKRAAAVKTSEMGVPADAPYQQVQPQQPPQYPGYDQAYKQDYNPGWDSNAHAGVYEMEVPSGSVAELGNGNEARVEMGEGDARPAEMSAISKDEKNPDDVRR
ncbi:hypothetical protein F5X68DRAFT_186585 [Plectosphaerella plurivora]|uniref:Uncharacterized protein n=1 Tax=Plectosphaerella plurivora TaxID=936078 RepID=A0A9P9AEG6_9PEZI|nr:hypothetical protein F5X68DRAFT_186585 [Plectosphaerella plurivora]